MDSNLEAIIQTLAYADIFDYPLTREEIWEYIIFNNKGISKKRIFTILNKKNKFFEKKDNFIFLKARENNIEKRIRREKESTDKIKRANRIIKILSLIPGVDFIGISGALSMKNSEKNDDIDLFVITKKKSVWTTRLIMIFVLKILRVYRNRKDKEVSNKICLNFLIDLSRLEFPKEKRDLFLAHEIAQIMPVFSRGRTYQDFFGKNLWVKDFLPNVSDKKVKFRGSKNFFNFFISGLISNRIFEYISKKMQFEHMKKNITKETVEDNFLAFHPFDYRSYVLGQYKSKIGKLI